MKYLRLLVILCCFSSVHSQDRWQITSQIDLLFPNQRNYNYGLNNRGFEQELESDGFLLDSFGLQGDINYFLFRKLSIGVVTGIQSISDPNFFMIKLGGVLRYHFVDDENIYVFLQDANNFSTNSNKFKSGNNFRIGLGFPFLSREKFNLNLILYFEQNFYKLGDGVEPILNIGETPTDLIVKSFGISCGISL